MDNNENTDTCATIDVQVIAWLNAADRLPTLPFFNGGCDVMRVASNVVYGDFEHGTTQRPMLLWWLSVDRLSAVSDDAIELGKVMHFELTDEGLTVLRRFPWFLSRSANAVAVACRLNGVLELAYRQLARLYRIARWSRCYYGVEGASPGESFVSFDRIRLPDPDDTAGEHVSDGAKDDDGERPPIAQPDDTFATHDARTLAWLHAGPRLSRLASFAGAAEDGMVYGDFPHYATERPMLVWWRSVGRLSAVRYDEMQADRVMHFEATEGGLAVLRMYPWHLVGGGNLPAGVTCDIDGEVEIAYKHLARLYKVECWSCVCYSVHHAPETYVCLANLSLPDANEIDKHDRTPANIGDADPNVDMEPEDHDTFQQRDARVLHWLHAADRLRSLSVFDGGHDLARVDAEDVYGDHPNLLTVRPMLVWWRSVDRLSAVRFDEMREDCVMHFEATDCGLEVLRMFPWSLVRAGHGTGISCYNFKDSVTEIAFRHLARLNRIARWKEVRYRKYANTDGETYVSMDRLWLPDEPVPAAPAPAAPAVPEVDAELDKLIRSRILRYGTQYRASIDGQRVYQPNTEAGYNVLYEKLRKHRARGGK